MQSLSESAPNQLETSSSTRVGSVQAADLGDLIYPVATIIAMLLLLGTLWVF
jgi:hypothetical protein